jgi:hypothetical protein
VHNGYTLPSTEVIYTASILDVRSIVGSHVFEVSDVDRITAGVVERDTPGHDGVIKLWNSCETRDRGLVLRTGSITFGIGESLGWQVEKGHSRASGLGKQEQTLVADKQSAPSTSAPAFPRLGSPAVHRDDGLQNQVHYDRPQWRHAHQAYRDLEGFRRCRHN